MSAHLPQHRALSSMRMRPIHWLWERRLPLGEVTIVQGDPGLGKGHIAADMAARITAGRAMPTEGLGRKPGRVLWLTTEDDPERVLKPRLAAAGADVALVTVLSDTDPIAFPSGAHALETLLAASFLEDPSRPVLMVVIDPLSQYADDGVDLNKTTQSRRVITALTAVARKFSLVILLVHHLNKTTSDKRQSALHRGAGNVSGIAGAARCVLMVGPDPEREEWTVLAGVKHNLSPRPDSICYRMESCTVHEGSSDFATSRLVWGERSTLRADDLAVLAAGNGGNHTEAEVFLREFLGAGPRWVRDVQDEAKQRGMSFGGAVRRASERMSIVKRLNTNGELVHVPPKTRYVWILP